MDTSEFLNTVLAEDGCYCVLGIHPKNGKRAQKFFTTREGAARVAFGLDLDGFNAYFAPATFANNKSRTANNVLLLKSLYLDVDCGADKPYKTQAEGFAALKRFCKEVEVPRPTIVVSSGLGLHVYWVLDTPCSRDVWLPVAGQLKQACTAHEFAVDPVVTTDAARVLRVPGTHNYKNDPPHDVEIITGTGPITTLEVMSAALPRLEASMVPVLPSRTYTPEDKASMDALTGSYTKKFSKMVEKNLSGKGCAQIHNAIMSPEKVSYPTWVDVLSVVKPCEEGALAVHVISSGHPNYSAEETDKVVASIKYPHLCATFEANNPAGCVGCPFRGKIKSPISMCMEVREAQEEDNVVEVPPKKKKVPTTPTAPVEDTFEFDDLPGGELTPEEVPEQEEVEILDVARGLFDVVSEVEEGAMQTYVIPKYPFPYFRGVNGGVYLRTKDKTGEVEEIEIHPCDLYMVKRIRDPVTGPAFLFRHHTYREGVQEFVIPSVKLSSREEFRKEFGINDIFTLKQEPLMMYVGAWIKQLQKTQDETHARTQFGWTEDHESFVVGDKEIFADRIEDNPPSTFTAQYFPYFHSKGTLEGWKRVTEFINAPGYAAHQFMFAMSFGSPLMEFIPNVSGGIFHAFSAESGHGKSTGQWGGASVWGDHRRLVLKGKDTENSIWNRAEVHKNLVLYIDEITNISPKAASDFAYAVTDGEQKTRLSNQGQNKERYKGAAWSLLVGTSGNSELLARMSQYKSQPKGEAQRVLEAEIQQLLFTPEEAIKARQFNHDLANNYGLAGIVYMQYLLKDLPAARRLVERIMDKITLEAELGPQNRIWAAQVGTTLAGAIVARHCGLIDWDIDALYAWSIAKLRAAKEYVRELDVAISDLITQYYFEFQGNILRIKSTDDRRGGDRSNIEQLVVPEKLPQYSWVGRYEYDTNKLFLVVKPFKDWCVKQQLHYGAILNMISDQLSGTREKVRLGKGTTVMLPSMSVISMTFALPEPPVTLPSEELFDVPSKG